MPPFVQSLAGIFLVLPGMALWGIGLLMLFSFACGIPEMILRGSPDDTSIIAIACGLGVTLFMILIGYSMMAVFDVLTTKSRYNIPSSHLVPCVALELLAQTLAAISFAITISAVVQFWMLADAPPWIVALLVLLGFSGCVAAILIHCGNLARRAKWKAAHAAALPQS